MANRLDRFFTWVWRINGVLLLAIPLTALAGGVVVLLKATIFQSHVRSEQKLSTVAGTDLSAKDLQLLNFRTIDGTQSLYASLVAPPEYSNLKSSSYHNDTRNLLFFDTTSRKAHWLFATNDQIIRSFSFLTDPPTVSTNSENGHSLKAQRVAIGLLLEVQKQEVSGESIMAPRSLAIASIDGRNLLPVANPIEEMLGYHQPDKGTVLIFYSASGSARVLDVDLVARKVRSDILVQE